MDCQVSLTCGTDSLNETQVEFYGTREKERIELAKLFENYKVLLAAKSLNANTVSKASVVVGSRCVASPRTQPRPITPKVPLPGGSSPDVYQLSGRKPHEYVLSQLTNNENTDQNGLQRLQPSLSITPIQNTRPQQYHLLSPAPATRQQRLSSGMVHQYPPARRLCPLGTPQQPLPSGTPKCAIKFGPQQPRQIVCAQDTPKMSIAVAPMSKLIDHRLHEKLLVEDKSPSANIRTSAQISSTSSVLQTELFKNPTPSKPASLPTALPHASTLQSPTMEEVTFKVVQSPSPVNQTPSQDDKSLGKRKKSVQEKTFPSLVVSVRCTLNTCPSTEVNNERLKLDNQMKRILLMTPAIVTEHLLQQRLLRSESVCPNHKENHKLGVHSYSTDYQNSGGYVWISQCCSNSYASVYCGSIFDKTVHRPTTILKLLYHWACNTSIHNVIQWVKVDNFTVKTYYTFFRAVCTTVVHEKSEMLGGTFRKVQVTIGNIGLASTSTSHKEANVEVLAAYEEGKKRLRLRVLQCDRSKGDHSEVFEILGSWIKPESTLITDFALDPNMCRQLGFAAIMATKKLHTVHSNAVLVEYLATTVQKMFQSSLRHLSLQIVQQFLDELVWRETWGPTPSRVFDHMVKHIAELTKLTGPDLITKLRKIASYPFRSWKYAAWEPGVTESRIIKTPLPIENNATQKQLLKANQQPSSSLVAMTSPSKFEKGKSMNNAICLEPYYYGCIKGDPTLQKTSGTFNIECALCHRQFTSRYAFYNHLINHAFHGGSVNRMQPQHLLSICKICLIPARGLEAHMVDQHSTAISEITTACKICNVKFYGEGTLLEHMTQVHCELDMPYVCQACNFRTSVYEHMAFHFKRCHAYDMCVQCPFCLKVVLFCTKSGVALPKNQHFFIQHIQKHCLKKLNRQCEKCTLSFTNLCSLRRHQEQHHTSAKHIPNVHRYKKNPVKRLYMPLPTTNPIPPLTSSDTALHTMKGKALPYAIKLSPNLHSYVCLECDSHINQNHFSRKMTCTKCSYQSMCANAIMEHCARFHMTAQPLQFVRHQAIGGSPLLSKRLFCSICPFSSDNGDLMAQHLLWCVRAVAVTIPPTLSEPPNKQMKF